jgi:hypothetical protein
MEYPENELHPRQAARARDTAGPTWDMSQERAFIENLLSQRFNFFLVFFSIVIAGAVNAKLQSHLHIILGIGFLVCVLLALTLDRSQEKLDLILEELFADEKHPACIINKKATIGCSRRQIIGYTIPRLCCSLLLLGFIFSLLDILHVPK